MEPTGYNLRSPRGRFTARASQPWQTQLPPRGTRRCGQGPTATTVTRAHHGDFGLDEVVGNL
ncbi:unnamed protein product [Prunus armeniaca]|uniref:Uncharacterized protein n=1 Tax=Prunus armeniaca TaxID=36596 RepID=A0A6J5W7N1_PRUAR|nr:unnamed protein product [Prunus armeniaca]